MEDTMTLQALHDKMIEEMPEGASHVEAECPFCSHEQIIEPHGGTMSKTYSEDEYKALVTAAVAEATKELSEELEGLKATKTVSEWETKISEMKASFDEQLAAIQTTLDQKEIEAEAAKKAHDDLVAYLDAEKATAEEEAAAEARKEERLKAVADAASFSEEYVAANTERWAKMDDDAFEQLLADYKSMSASAGATSTGGTGIPAATALVATRKTEGGVASAAREVIRLYDQGIDPRQIIR